MSDFRTLFPTVSSTIGLELSEVRAVIAELPRATYHSLLAEMSIILGSLLVPLAHGVVSVCLVYSSFAAISSEQAMKAFGQMLKDGQ